MTKFKKQSKITKLFRKAADPVQKQAQPSDTEDLENEIQQLEQELNKMQMELFQLKCLSLKRRLVRPKKREEMFVRPQKITLENSVDHIKRSLQLLGMVTGTEVTTYRPGVHCCVVYHMQQDHGLKILMKGADKGENQIESSALPLGFNLNAVLEDFDSVMTPECLGAVRKALVAYYDRLEQYQSLQKVAHSEAELFKTLDGSHIQISLFVQNETDQDELDDIKVTLVLDYRIYDIRPKTFAIKDEEEFPEGAADILRAKCSVFKKKPLDVAFKEAFLDGIGNYQLMQQMGRGSLPPSRPRRRHGRPHRPYNDDTFVPEECSDQGDDDDDAHV